MRRGTFNIKLGQISSDFNGNRGINALENSVSSLFFRHNYLKLYENNFVRANNRIDIFNGFQLNTSLTYARRVMLENHSYYSFFYRDLPEYTPNIPLNEELRRLFDYTNDEFISLPDHTSVVFNVSLEYTPRFYYRIDKNNRKRMVKSPYPTFFASWQKGVNGLFGSDSNFDHISGGLHQKIEPGLMQTFHYSVSGGVFLNTKRIFFPDFKHFTTVEVPVTVGFINGRLFNLLEYYRYSASDKYLEAHASYYTPFLVLKLLPFFSNRMLWKESLLFNYLYTPIIKNYVEFGYTIGTLPLWETGIFVGFENFSYRYFGVKLSFPIGNVQFN